MTEFPADWPIRGQDSPPSWESQHLRTLLTLLTWHAADMRSWRAELGVSAVFSHSRDKSSCEERIWEIWESCQEQRIRNMWKTTAQLRYHYCGCKTGLILVNSINSRLLAPRYLHFFTSKIPVSALCSYAQTNISPYLDLARLRPEQIEIFIWAYLHTAYAELWGGGGDAGRVATVSDDSYDIFGSDLMMISLYLILGVESNNKEDSAWRVARFRGRQGSIRDVQFWFIGPLSN